MENFTKEQVVPDVVKAAPDAKLTVQWDGKDLEPGAQLTPTQVKDQPHLEWKTEEGTLYTLIFTDPDAPSRTDPKSREFLHWLVTNIPGCDISKGEEFAAYVGAGAPKDTGLHRYCFFVFKQPGKIQEDLEKADKFTIGKRKNFKTQAFADKHSLGTAVVGNFFLAEYDDYVPTLHAQMQFVHK